MKEYKQSELGFSIPIETSEAVKTKTQHKRPFNKNYPYVIHDNKTKVIHFRSASRIGYSDMGVNRKRMERIRGLFYR